MTRFSGPAATRRRGPAVTRDRGTVMIAAHLLMYVVLCALGLASYHPADRLAESWSWPALGAGALMFAWPGRGAGRGAGRAASRGTGWRRFVACLGVLVVTPAVVAALVPGLDALTGLRLGAATTAAVTAGLAAYRVLGSGSWFPHRLSDVPLLASTTGLAGAASIALGGVPAAGLGGTGSWPLDMAWFVRYQVGCIFAVLAIVSLWHPPRPQHAAARVTPLLPLLVPLSVGCLTIPYVYPQYPIAWVVFVPAVWAGLTLTPRGLGVAAIAIPIAPAIISRSSLAQFGAATRLPAQLVMEFLLAISIVMAYVIVVLRENTARVAMGNLAGAEAEAAQNGLLNTVIETIDDGVLLVDPGGRIVMSNPAARRFLGSGKARVGTVWAAPDGLRDATGALLSRERLRDLLMEPGAGAVPVVLRSPTTQGRQRVYSVSAHPLGRRQPPLTIVVISDVSAEHDRHSQLETFAGAVAHDLKNPLASLALWMDLADVEAEFDVEGGRAALHEAREVGLRMRDLIDDYLAYTVTREGTLRPATLELGTLAADVARLYAAEGDAVRLSIDAPQTVHADPALVRQLLSNLVANSVKYRRADQPARIHITGRADAVPGWIRVDVVDRGLGIAPAERDRVFEPFSRSARDQASGRGGVGMGLALCHAIVTRHGGTITAAGNQWGGTTITFTLPEARAAVAV